MIDKKFIGTISEPHSAAVEKGQLLFFAKAVGETNPIYTDEDAARAAGYRALPAPPTFAFSLNMSRPDQFGIFAKMGVDLGKVLHGEQKFEYFGDICAGDVISFESKITDIYDKKDGALEFIVEETSGTNQNGKVVVKLTGATVVRH